MTTYTTIPDADIDPDSPITTSLVTLLRDNPIAITEGASGAPKVQTAGITDDAVTDGKLASPATGTTVVKYIAGTVPIAITATTATTWTDNYGGCGILDLGTALVSGVINVQFDFNETGAGITYANVMVNGVTQGTVQTTTSAAYSTRGVDATITPGALVQIDIYSTDAGNYKNVVVRADSAKLCIS